MLQLEILGTSINNLKLYNTEKVCKEQYNTWNNSQYLKPISNSFFEIMLHETHLTKIQHSIMFLLPLNFDNKQKSWHTIRENRMERYACVRAICRLFCFILISRVRCGLLSSPGPCWVLNTIWDSSWIYQMVSQFFIR